MCPELEHQNSDTLNKALDVCRSCMLGELSSPAQLTMLSEARFAPTRLVRGGPLCVLRSQAHPTPDEACTADGHCDQRAKDYLNRTAA
jgi:hypothetical protein